MTNKEAIERLKCNYPDFDYEKLREAYDMAISALEKQIPKKPKKFGINRLCPVCEWNVFPDIENAYCYKCGQAIDWRKRK